MNTQGTAADHQTTISCRPPRQAYRRHRTDNNLTRAMERRRLTMPRWGTEATGARHHTEQAGKTRTPWESKQNLASHPSVRYELRLQRGSSGLPRGGDEMIVPWTWSVRRGPIPEAVHAPPRRVHSMIHCPRKITISHHPLSPSNHHPRHPL